MHTHSLKIEGRSQVVYIVIYIICYFITYNMLYIIFLGILGIFWRCKMRNIFILIIDYNVTPGYG